MSTWAAPITFTSGATLTAAQLNGTRDNLTFLKGALDLLTGSTTADTGTAMRLDLTLASSTALALKARVTGDAFERVTLSAAGTINWTLPTTGVSQQRIEADTSIRQLKLIGSDGVTRQNNQLIVELGVTPGLYSALGVMAQSDTQPRVLLGTDASHRGQVGFGVGGGTAADVFITRTAASTLTTTRLNLTDWLEVDGSAVVGPGAAGWGSATGTIARTAFDTATVTTAQLAQRVGALISDLMNHGLITP